jgi:deoxyribodipyrimidine photo-lyase
MTNIVWFKRDLRWADHEPLFEAIRSGDKTIGLFVVEPILIESEHYSNRHWKFMLECAQEVRNELRKYGGDLHVLEGEFTSILNELKNEYTDLKLFSHMETGIDLTFKRDIVVKNWCKDNAVEWTEYSQQAVQRGRKNRKDWTKEWDKFMYATIKPIDLSQLNGITLSEDIQAKFAVNLKVVQEHIDMQKGGRSLGLRYLNSFFENRNQKYGRHISKPAESRTSCSRISPYLAWGALSLREVVQGTVAHMDQLKYKRNLANFKSRLHWHCHFIQKLESEPQIEFKNQNPAFDRIRNDLNTEWLERWEIGQTGIPLVDACMRCLNATGYINFRMRAMLVSLWTHHLMQPWQAAADHLSKQFLDFEPGIHFAQIQMQAGTVGYHTLRTYNPTKQALEHDPEASFIKKWVPELNNLPPKNAITPWTLTAMEQMMYDFQLGKSYPEPICDIEKAGKVARDTLHEIKNSKTARQHTKQISDVHVNK